jgi:hypothetical protein
MDCIRYVTLLLFVTRLRTPLAINLKVNGVLDPPLASLNTIDVKSNTQPFKHRASFNIWKPWSLKRRASQYDRSKKRKGFA